MADMWWAAATLAAAWAVVAVYVLRRARGTATVPFVRLWRGTAAVAGRTGGVRWPGVAAAAALTAAALTAVAGVGVTVGRGGRDSVTVVVDRRGGVDREAVGRIAAAVTAAGVDRVWLVSVPGGTAEWPAAEWAAAAVAGAADGGPDVRAVVAEQLRATAGPVVVLTGQPVGFDDGRVVVVRPRIPGRRGAILDVAVRAEPRPQVMVRVGGGPRVVRVTSGGATVEKTVEGGTAFVDLPVAGDVVRVDAIGGGTVWVARQAGAATVDGEGDVPAAVGRVAASYGREHSAATGRRVQVRTTALAEGQAGVQVVDAGPGGPAVTAVTPGPVTDGVRAWPTIGGAKPPAGFRAVVSNGDAVGVAVRDGPDRQAWVNLDLRAWDRSADFVVFVADVLDWVGRAGDRYGSVPPRRLGAGWQVVEGTAAEPAGIGPGVYRRTDDGELLAVNDPVDPEDEAVRLPAVGRPGRSTAGVACLLGLAALVVAAAAWPSKMSAEGR